MIAAYTYARSVPDCCLRLLQKLTGKEWSWEFLPTKFRIQKRAQSLRWGRVVLEFGPEDWKPNIVAGFLLDGGDHQVDLCDPQRGFDIYFGIDGPSGVKVEGQAVVAKANALRERFPDAQVTGQNQAKNRWRKLMVRKPLADVIGPHATEDAQATAIYKQFEAWCIEVFADGEMQKAFLETWPTET
jgi:hypothetical protein